MAGCFVARPTIQPRTLTTQLEQMRRFGDLRSLCTIGGSLVCRWAMPRAPPRACGPCERKVTHGIMSRPASHPSTQQGREAGKPGCQHPAGNARRRRDNQASGQGRGHTVSLAWRTHEHCKAASIALCGHGKNIPINKPRSWPGARPGTPRNRANLPSSAAPPRSALPLQSWATAGPAVKCQTGSRGRSTPR